MHSKGGRARARDVLLRSVEIAGLDIVISHLRSVRRGRARSADLVRPAPGEGRPLANPVRGEGMTGNAKGVRFCFSSASDVWRVGYILPTTFPERYINEYLSCKRPLITIM
jgi:hypothetical protein